MGQWVSTWIYRLTADNLVTCMIRYGYDIDNIIIATIFLWSSAWGHSCPFPVRHCEVTPLHIWSHLKDMRICMMSAGIILYMHPANERWIYSVTPSLIAWAHTQNDHCSCACMHWWCQCIHATICSHHGIKGVRMGRHLISPANLVSIDDKACNLKNIIHMKI